LFSENKHDGEVRYSHQVKDPGIKAPPKRTFVALHGRRNCLLTHAALSSQVPVQKREKKNNK